MGTAEEKSRLGRTLGKRKDRNPITAYRTEPEVFADLNGDGSHAEPVNIRISNQFLELQSGWIDPHDVRCLGRRDSSLTGSQVVAAASSVGNNRRGGIDAIIASRWYGHRSRAMLSLVVRRAHGP